MGDIIIIITTTATTAIAGVVVQVDGHLVCGGCWT